MSSNSTKSTMGRAEAAFRSAFERLKAGTPNLLPKGTKITQNNVAREAGVDASALKKLRFPSLIAEIQLWIDEHEQVESRSARQTTIARRNSNRDTRERLEAMKAQRDHALGLLAEADILILELTMENEKMKAMLPSGNITKIKKT